MRAVTLLITALAAALAACADLPQSKDSKLTYETVPAGAEIFEGGQSLGVAPVNRIYKHDGKSTTIKTPDVTAVWPSGAKAIYFTILPLGADRVATIDRPADAPGLQVDLENAKKIAAAEAREAQRVKEATARDLARNSARCKDQMSKGGTAPVSDCN
jgi:hypothetical protein